MSTRQRHHKQIRYNSPRPAAPRCSPVTDIARINHPHAPPPALQAEALQPLVGTEEIVLYPGIWVRLRGKVRVSWCIWCRQNVPSPQPIHLLVSYILARSLIQTHKHACSLTVLYVSVCCLSVSRSIARARALSLSSLSPDPSGRQPRNGQA
jgi:hypothetical protein